MATVRTDRIRQMAESIRSHRAVNNRFYELWMARELNEGQVEIVARNFHAHVAPTVHRIGLAFLRMSDLKARSETVANMADELGGGDPNRAHVLLLEAFFEGLLSRMRGQAVKFADLNTPILPATLQLVERGAALFGSPNQELGCGALLAQEWHAYPQLVKLYEGARNYRHYYELEEFHENCEYFYIHIGEAEKDHKEQSISSAARICRTTEQLALLNDGFTTYLDLLGTYWEQLYLAVQEC